MTDDALDAGMLARLRTGFPTNIVVYAPLYRRRLIAAVVASGMVGAIIDSAVFLWLAFGSLDFIAGQVVGKAWMTLLAVPLIFIARHLQAKETTHD